MDYVAEDGATLYVVEPPPNYVTEPDFYVAEDGITQYVIQIFVPLAE